MSMTVTIITRMTDLDLLLEALETMGDVKNIARKRGRKGKVHVDRVAASIRDRQVGFEPNMDGQLVMTGDSDWAIMRDRHWMARLHQQYSVAAVKRKIREMNYNIASIETTGENAVRIVARAWG